MLNLIPQISLEELRGIASGANMEGYREKKDLFFLSNTRHTRERILAIEKR